MLIKNCLISIKRKEAKKEFIEMTARHLRFGVCLQVILIIGLVECSSL